MVSTISADRLRCKNKVNSDEDDAPIQSRLFRESAKKMKLILITIHVIIYKHLFLWLKIQN